MPETPSLPNPASQAREFDPIANADAGTPATSKPTRPSRPEGIPEGALPQELHNWEVQEFDLEAFLVGLREVEQTGGLELQDFIQELERNETSGG